MRPMSVLALACALAALASAPSWSAPRPPAFDRADLDTTCAPCADFARFANGGWLARQSIPAAFSSWGSFDVLEEQNQLTLLGILGKASATRGGSPDAPTRRIGDYYAACMDSLAAEAAGATPMQPLLADVDGMATRQDLAAQLAWLHAHGVRAAFGLGATPDPRRSDLTIASFSQGGLGLPDRDYYVRDDSASVALRADYVAHVQRTFALLGRADAAGEAATVMAMESALAHASMTNVQRRDPNAVYHKVPMDSLRVLCGGLDWSRYFERRGVRAPDSVNVQQLRFATVLDSLVSVATIDEWKTYLRWKIVDDAAPLLSNAFVNEDFAFRQKLTGAKEMLPRWKRCLRATDQDLGDLLGQAYVRERFSPRARERALALVRNLEAALGERIAALEWMSPQTQRAARAKLDAFANKIGYPDLWRDYAGVSVTRGGWLANRLECRRWETNRLMQRIGQPVDKREWSMTPPTVNAFYSSSFNSINFPAGILQPPFYDPSWDDALNYGAIGAVIGHEMTHGFDDRGRQFDAAGNLRDWWTADDAARYKERAQKVIDQFDAYTVAGGVPVNGKLTLGENIADLGGLAVAYAAFEKATAGRPRRTIDGFTPEQRFFLSWARVWRSLERDESLVTRVKTDPHSPDDLRINGPLSNLDEFRKAFGCREGDAMVREAAKRARIW